MSTSKPNSTSRSMSKERWNSFMDTRWEELFTHPESPAMTEYQLLELEPLDGSRHLSNFCWVPSLLYVITRRMGMLSHRSRRRVIEYFFHLLSGVIYALELFEDGVVTQDDPCDVRIDEVYAYIWKEVSSQLRAIEFDPTKDSEHDLPNPEYVDLWDDTEKDCIKMICGALRHYLSSVDDTYKTQDDDSDEWPEFRSIFVRYLFND